VIEGTAFEVRGIEDGEVVVVDFELGATVGVGGVDPPATAEEPIARVAVKYAIILAHSCAHQLLKC
jgi:hypothetical protein